MGRTTAILETIGRYEVLEAIATGGMAEVYEVRDRVTREHHAMKLLMENEGRKMFDLEYEIMNHLNHPSVVRLYLYGRHRGLPWFSMEYLTAQTASAHVRDAGKPGTARRNQEVIRLGALAARALHHVHQRGVVHRDVKSANILVLPDQRVKLVDFGVAHLGEPGEPIPPSSHFAGTLGYAAPEQILLHSVDHRADLYALGVLLYRLATGKMPFKHDSLSNLIELQRGAAPDPSKLVSDLPKPLTRMIAAMLQPKPDDRPRDAGQVADVLDSIAGRTQLPGSELAIHRVLASARHSERHRLSTSTAPLMVVAGADPVERERVLSELVARSRADGKAADLTTVADAGDRAAMQAILVGARDVGEGGSALFAVQLGSGVAAPVLRLLKSVVDAVRRLPGAIRVVVGCDPEVAAAFEGAEIVELAALSAHETALAVGVMVGRRPPAGALAQRIHAVTLGWPTAIEAVTREIVQGGSIEAEGNQILWARYDPPLSVPDSLYAVMLARVKATGSAERLVLDALAQIGGATEEAIRGNLPGTDAIATAIAGLIEHGILVRDPGDGSLRLASASLASVICERPLASHRAVLERLFVKAPELLPLGAFRVRAMVRAGRLDVAVREATELAATWVEEGLWFEAAELLHEVRGATRGQPVGPELAELLLLFASCAPATRSADAHEAMQAVATVRAATNDPSLSARCDLVEAHLHLAIGHYGNYSKQVLRAGKTAASLDSEEMAAMVQQARGQSELWSGNVRSAERVFGTGESAEILVGRARCAIEQGRLAEAEALAWRVVSDERARPLAQATALRVWADALRRAGRYTDALAELRSASVRLRTHPDQRPFLTVMLGIGWCEVDLHRLGLAQECVDELAAAVRKGELLHYRIERDLLDAWISLLSGRAMHADFTLQGVVRKAKTAGLRSLADQGTNLMIEAQQAARVGHQDLEAWYQSRLIAFLADKLVWIFADACLAYIRHHPSRPNPDEILARVLEAVQGEDAFGLQIEALIVRSERALEDGRANDALMASRDAASRLARIMKGLADSERGAFRVHPWNRRIAAALAGAQRASGVPASRR